MTFVAIDAFRVKMIAYIEDHDKSIVETLVIE